MLRNFIKYLIVFAILQEINAAIKPSLELELKEAEHCNVDKCQAPLCRCSGLTLPKKSFRGREKEIPQFITVTFDDAITVLNYPQYQKLLANLRNPDGCDAQACFYVSHEYTDYSKVNALYNQGHEIGLHSLTHSTGTDYWLNATVDILMREFGQERKTLEKFANMDRRHIRGMRLPFLQLSGNNSFIAAKKLGLLYDSSWPTDNHPEPPMWPYTLDYHSTQDCPIEPCPTVALPGLWEYPMESWTDNAGYSCSMMDGCLNVPSNDVDGVFNWMQTNFKRHYDGNRAPFGMYLHAGWFARSKNYFTAFRRFLEYVNSLPDVYLVTPQAVIRYMRYPKLGKPFKGCFKKPNRPCKPVTCPLNKESTGEMRYMTVCDNCPETYPWLDNPLGVKKIKKTAFEKKASKGIKN